jgi:hypothetical protein
VLARCVGTPASKCITAALWCLVGYGDSLQVLAEVLNGRRCRTRVTASAPCGRAHEPHQKNHGVTILMLFPLSAVDDADP